MSVNNLFCCLNMPDALEISYDEKGNENAQSLPPYNPIKPHVVDEYSCPENWMHGSSKASSYFIPIETGKGMWLDFNENSRNSHDVAVVVSVQGINPITGQKTTTLILEQYRDKCPLHNKDFGQDRFCESCKFCWEPQNYLALSAQPGRFWIDGFRNDKGEVRQYVFTEEESLGVASQIIGNDRVYAIGIAFYESKEPKPIPQRIVRSLGYASSAGGQHCNSSHYSNYSGPITCSDYDDIAVFKRQSLKKIEIGAGAKINQRIGFDNHELSYWKDEPSGLIYINYVSQEVCESILSQGKKDRTASGEGFLKSIKKVTS